MKLLLVLALLLGSTACTRNMNGGGYIPYTPPPPLVLPSISSASRALLIFGGADHRTFLGCLNCSEYNSSSVFNQYGSFGSSYSSTSIWNHYGDFGSAYSQRSACNDYATDAPVIVDSDGHYYGRLTVNSYHREIGIGEQYIEWLKEKVCA